MSVYRTIGPLVFPINTGYYATLVNLGHPEIWKQIEPSLKKAQEAMKKGKKFCVEVSSPVEALHLYEPRYEKTSFCICENYSTIHRLP